MGALDARIVDELGYDPDADRAAGRRDVRQLDLKDASEGTLASSAAEGRRGLIDVPVGALVAARDGARAVAVARLASGKVVVVDDVCPHDGGRISDGFVEGERLVCARHGWELVACGGRCERAPR